MTLARHSPEAGVRRGRARRRAQERNRRAEQIRRAIQLAEKNVRALAAQALREAAAELPEGGAGEEVCFLDATGERRVARVRAVVADAPPRLKGARSRIWSAVPSRTCVRAAER